MYFLNENLFSLEFHQDFYQSVQSTVDRHWFKNGLALNRSQAIIWTNGGLVRHLEWPHDFLPLTKMSYLITYDNEQLTKNVFVINDYRNWSTASQVLWPVVRESLRLVVPWLRVISDHKYKLLWTIIHNCLWQFLWTSGNHYILLYYVAYLKILLVGSCKVSKLRNLC